MGETILIYTLLIFHYHTVEDTEVLHGLDTETANISPAFDFQEEVCSVERSANLY